MLFISFISFYSEFLPYTVICTPFSRLHSNTSGIMQKGPDWANKNMSIKSTNWKLWKYY